MRRRVSYLRHALPGIAALVLLGCYQSVSQQSGPVRIEPVTPANPASAVSAGELVPAATDTAEPASVELAAGTVAVVLSVPGMH